MFILTLTIAINACNFRTIREWLLGEETGMKMVN